MTTPATGTREGLPAPAASTARHDMVILTGMSGAGRTTAGDVLEDRGWYVVDNLPPAMVPRLMELTADDPHRQKVAVIVDVRSRDFTTELSRALEDLGAANWQPRIIFVDSSDEALVRRFEAVRRPHPLQGEGLLLDGIRRERRMLGDLRFLPNPYWIPELRPFTGQDGPVRDFVLGQDNAGDFLDHAEAMLRTAVRGYLEEGRRYLTVAVGCTGGKHRSVATAEELTRRLMDLDDVGVQLSTFHRDLGRE